MTSHEEKDGSKKSQGVFMSTSLAWVLLSIAGLLEVCWAIGLKYTDGFTKLGPSVFTLVCLAASMFLLAKASQVLPIGTAYAIWVGIGALGAALFGILLLKEPASVPRIVFLCLLPNLFSTYKFIRLLPEFDFAINVVIPTIAYNPSCIRIFPG